MKIKIDGKYIDDFTFIKNFTCDRCGCHGDVEISYKSSNNALQVRCEECGKFIGNFKYDDNYGGADDGNAPA